jgi:hypothetical protein
MGSVTESQLTEAMNRIAGVVVGMRGRQSGIALATRIDSMVRATMTHSERQPTASDAATAWVNRDDATSEVRA